MIRSLRFLPFALALSFLGTLSPAAFAKKPENTITISPKVRQMMAQLRDSRATPVKPGIPVKVGQAPVWKPRPQLKTLKTR